MIGYEHPSNWAKTKMARGMICSEPWPISITHYFHNMPCFYHATYHAIINKNHAIIKHLMLLLAMFMLLSHTSSYNQQIMR